MKYDVNLTSSFSNNDIKSNFLLDFFNGITCFAIMSCWPISSSCKCIILRSIPCSIKNHFRDIYPHSYQHLFTTYPLTLSSVHVSIFVGIAAFYSKVSTFEQPSLLVCYCLTCIQRIGNTLR